jgi:hypothetical protein
MIFFFKKKNKIKPLLDSSQISKLTISSTSICEITYKLTQDIRNLHLLTDEQKIYINSLTKDELIQIIYIYNECIDTLKYFIDK